MIEPSNNQTKEWRCNQPWYLNGKHKECEKYQISLIEEITGVKLNNGKTIYYNLKMICGSGGGQTRALREV